MEDQEAATVARAFYTNWIVRFGTPLRVTTDQGRQFESNLFKHLNRLTGTTHIRTTAYHPAANGMVERFHRQLKAAIMCHETTRWTETLPTVLLGIRSAWKDDLQSTIAEMVYGEALRLPGEFISPQPDTEHRSDATTFADQLRQHFHSLRPIHGSRHGQKPTFVYKDLATCTHVLVRRHSVKRPLQQPYDGPYKVIKRGDKTFTALIGNRIVTVSIERLKPAFILTEDSETISQQLQDSSEDIVVTPEVPSQPPEAHNRYQLRSGRTVRFPDRFQAGFS